MRTIRFLLKYNQNNRSADSRLFQGQEKRHEIMRTQTITFSQKQTLKMYNTLQVQYFHLFIFFPRSIYIRLKVQEKNSTHISLKLSVMTMLSNYFNCTFNCNYLTISRYFISKYLYNITRYIHFNTFLHRHKCLFSYCNSIFCFCFRVFFIIIIIILAT